MIDNIILFYEKNLTINSLLKNKFKWKYHLLKYSFFVSLIISEFLLISNINSVKTYVSLFLLIFILVIIYIFIYNYMVKRIRKGLNINKNEFNSYFSKELERYLKKHKYLIIEDEIINMLEDRLIKIKETFLFQYGVISALVLIAFSSFCNKLYDLIGADLKFFAIITLTIFTLIYLFVIIANTYKGFYENLYTNFYSVNRLISILQENKLSRKIVENPTTKRCRVKTNTKTNDMNYPSRSFKYFH